MDQIEDLTNSDLQIPFLSIPPSVHGKINDVVGVYGVDGLGKAFEGQEGVQNLLLVRIYSLYAVSLIGRFRSTV